MQYFILLAVQDGKEVAVGGNPVISQIGMLLERPFRQHPLFVQAKACLNLGGKR